MKTQIIPLEAHDDFISVRDRMSWAKSPRILLVWPKFEKIVLRAADLRILQQHASTLGAQLGVITRRGDVRRDAERFGIPVFTSAAAAQRQSWGPRRRVTAPLVRKKPRERSELEAMKAAVKPRDADWLAKPASRVGFFALGVLAVLAIAGLFVPEATITLTPVAQEQAIQVPVTASEDTEAISLTGMVPARSITVTVQGSQSARVGTRSNIPDAKASGIARFTNLTQSSLTIPKGTILYSLSPAAVQFATQNETRLPGNVNAVVEVPISAVYGGAEANLPANSIQAIQGSLSLSVAVTNPESTHGGTDRLAAAPGEADRQRLHDVLVDALKDQARSQITDLTGAGDLLLTNTLKAAEVKEEVYDPPAGKPGNLLNLRIRMDFTAQYLAGKDLHQLAEVMLDGAKPGDYLPVPDSIAFQVQGEPRIDAAGAIHFDLQIRRKLVHVLNLAQANSLARGLAPWAAAATLQARLPLATRPEIRLSPPWWPWMPLIPFRVSVTTTP
ncbi:MAG: baseplate J/gp47 family protein [Anaerolineae bacterium]